MTVFVFYLLLISAAFCVADLIDHLSNRISGRENR